MKQEAFLKLLTEIDEEEDEFDDVEESPWHQAACAVAAAHGVNHCIREPCRTAPYTGDGIVRELLLSRHSRRCQEVLRMPFNTFVALVEFCREYTSLEAGREISIEEKLMIFLSIVGQPMTNRGAQERYQHSGETIYR